MTGKPLSYYVDSIGVVASSACALHCLLTPVLVAILPVMGVTFWAAGWFEDLTIIGAISLGVISLLHGYLHHGQFRVFGLLMVGVLLLIAGRWLLTQSSVLIETALVVLGGLAVATAHLVNRRLCHQCRKC